MAVEMKNVLITGGAGFIGSHIAEECATKGCRVTVVDNLSTGHLSNLDPIRNVITFVEGDIRDEKLMNSTMDGCDVVFHHAAVVSVTQTVSDPVGSTDVNDVGTLKVLDAARRNNVGRVVLASSSAVYGDDPQLPKVESMTPKPLSPYAVQKLTNEYYAGLYYQLYGLEAVCLRYFNVYGPRQDPTSPYSGVISIFMQRAAQKKVPTIYGDGKQTRDFVFVKDVVQANLLAAVQNRASDQVLNVGTGEAISVKDLWHRIADMSQFEAEPEYAGARSGDILHSLADIAKTKEILTFQPTIALDRGLSETLNWYRNMMRS
jgi:UDP-glucose 4-epimerase